jgi:hypothetical protein
VKIKWIFMLSPIKKMNGKIHDSIGEDGFGQSYESTSQAKL